MHSAVQMTAYKVLVSWKTLPLVMVIMKTNFNSKLFVSLVKQGKLYLPSQPKFVITVLLGACALAVIEKDVVLWKRLRKPYTTLELVLSHL